MGAGVSKSLRQCLELDPGTDKQKGRKEFLATYGIISLPWVTITVPGYTSHVGELRPRSLWSPHSAPLTLAFIL